MASVDADQLSATGQNICGCEGTREPGSGTDPRPGLPALSLRVGATHGEYLARMRRRLPLQEVPPGHPHGREPLSGWTVSREGGDATDAVLDAAATALDVLSFYHERIANEGYLRTATERRSLLELARTIGYELRPGVAASVWLAFTVEAITGAPENATIPAGTPVQSIPGGSGEVPQTFETSAVFEARAEWNDLRPLRMQEQPLTTAVDTVYLAGTGLRLQQADLLLIAVPGADGAPTQTRVVAVESVEEQLTLQRTRVDVVNAVPGPPPPPPPPRPPSPIPLLAQVSLKVMAFNATNIGGQVFGQAWRERDLKTLMGVQRWEARKLVTYINQRVVERAQPAPPLPAAETGVFAFRESLGVFGHNAPRWDSLPATQRFGERVQLESSTAFKPPAYPRNWDTDPPPVNRNSRDELYAPGGDVMHLERAVPTLRPNAWMVLVGAGVDPKPYRIAAVNQRSVADFGLSAKASGVQVSDNTGLATFTMRGTTVYADSQPLPLAPLPIEESIAAGDTQLVLDRLVLGLAVGQAVVLTGERADLPGVTESEVLFLREVVHVDGLTALTFTTALRSSYVRSTVSLNANVVLATHGETVAEVLGGGEGSLPNQTFPLRRPPLTYVSANTESGTQTTLQVRVDGVLWEEVPHLYGSPPDARRYVVRREDDGSTCIMGGDGRQGARFPTGLENVTAAYRTGIGLVGQVREGQLTLLSNRPLGISSVVNPLAAGGAADPESRDDARTNAPLTVRTIDRIVSLRDYEDFARAFAGVGKAQAVALRKGANRLVHLTVAGADGSEIPADSPTFQNLVAAIRRFGDPQQRFKVESFDLRYFRLVARLRLDTPKYLAADVLEAAHTAVLETFSFPRRDFGQPVTRAEVTTVLQSVTGVLSVDVDVLHLIAEGIDETALEDVLPANPARWQDPRAEQNDPTVLRGELLLLSPIGAELTERTGPA